MNRRNLLIISDLFPNPDNSYFGSIFVKNQVEYLKEHFDNVYVISPVAYGVERFRKTTHHDYQYDNVKVFFPRYLNILFFYKFCRWVWVFLEARAIISLIEKEKLDFGLIHAHFTWPSGVVATDLKKRYHVPVVITEGSSRTFQRAIDQRNRYYINSYEMCDAIIRNNKKDLPLLRNLGLSENKIHYVEYGYDEKIFFPIPKYEAREELGISHSIKLILTIGRLSEEKGHIDLIDALAVVVKENPDVICIIGGTGSLKQELERRIADMQLTDVIKLIGFVPNKQMPLWISAADFFVLPSLSEGNPTVMLECLGCGTPFVGTKVGGIPDVITTDDYGLLVEPSNPIDLADKMSLALTKEWNREKILEYAEQYSSRIAVQKILAIYKNIKPLTNK